MSRLEELYEIRRAHFEEIPEIQHYIDTYWCKGHVLAASRKLFLYEFVDESGQVNMYICKDRETGEIHSIMGYLPCSQDKEHLDVWTVMWHARTDNKVMLLGIETYKALRFSVGARSYLGVGDNPNTTTRIEQKIFQSHTGKMEHYYLLNRLPGYKIASIQDAELLQVGCRRDDPVKLREFVSISELEQVFDLSLYKDTVPYLDTWYINQRYFQHPVYHYQIYGLMEAEKCKGVLILRRLALLGHDVCRIVRYLGEEGTLAHSGDALRKLLDDTTEYIDFYNAGFSEQVLLEAGFRKRAAEDKNIIPNYFEPFLRENVDIYYSSTTEPVTVCKGDADQDRPNLLPEWF